MRHGARRSRRRRLIGMAVALTTLALACGTPDVDQTAGVRSASVSDEVVKVGLVGPMSGEGAFIGRSMVEGVRLAVDDLRAEGGVVGRDVQIVQRDDGGDPARTLTAARELINHEGVAAIIGPAGVSTTSSIEQLVGQEEVPIWAITPESELSESGNPYVFRAYLPDTTQIEPLVSFASSRYSRIAVVYANVGESIAYRDEAVARLRDEGVDAVAVESYEPGESDLSPLALKLRAAGADAVLLDTHHGIFGARVATALQNVGHDAQILGMAGLINHMYPDLARDAADGTIFVSFKTWIDKPRDEWPGTVSAYVDRYAEEYLEDGVHSVSGADKTFAAHFLTYDSVRVWAHAVEKAGSVDPRAVTETLNAGLTYPVDRSVIGVPWRYTDTQRDGIDPSDLLFYRWERTSPGKLDLRILGSTSDVLAGRAGV